MLDPETNRYLTLTGPGTPAGTFFRRFWLPVMLGSELPVPDGDPVRVKILGEELLAFRDTTSQIGLVEPYCAHRLAPLFFGRNENCGIRCVYHGWKYDVTGQCVDTPNEPPTSRMKDRVKIKAYPTQEAGGVVWAYLGPDDKVPPMPDLEWLALPAENCYVDKFATSANWLQSLEGDFDSSHATLLHSSVDAGSFSDAWQQEDKQFTDFHARDKAPLIDVHDTDAGLIVGARRKVTDDLFWWRITPYLMPTFAIVSHEPGTALLANIRIPIDDVSCWTFRVNYHPGRALTQRDRAICEHLSGRFPRKIPGTFITAENRGNDYLIDRQRQRFETFTGIHSVPAQDLAVQEGMAPDPVVGLGLVDRSREHLGAADAAIVRLRERLIGTIRDLEVGIEPPAVSNPRAYFRRAPAVVLPAGVPFLDGAADYIEGRSWERQIRDEAQISISEP